MNEIKPFHLQLHGYIRYQLRKHFNTKNETLINENGPIPDYLHQKLIANTYAEDLKLLEIPQMLKNYDDQHDTINSGARRTIQQIYKNSTLIDSTTKMLTDVKTIYRGWGFDTSKLPLTLIVDENSWHPKFDESFGRNELKFKIGINYNETQYMEMFSEYFKYLEYTYGYGQPWILRKLIPKAFGNGIINALKHSIQNMTYSSDITSKNILINEHRFITKAIQQVLSIQSKFVTSQTIKCLQIRKSKDENCNFWSNKLQIQGISTDSFNTDSDVLAWKLNGWDEDDYGDMLSIILGFQIYEGLCEKLEIKTNILANCNFLHRSEIGDLIKKILTDGSSISWNEQIKILLPKDQQNNEIILSAKSMLKYFQPLHDWLEEYNKKHGVKVGW